MTRDNDTMATGVTQADREAAAEMIVSISQAANIRRGLHDGHGYVQAFARHRTQSTQPYIDALKDARVCIDQLERVARVHSETANARTLLATINELIGEE